MEVLWFSILAFMITMYVVLDGFDLGAGVLHLLIAKTEDERRTILNAIGPVWDGNEVWLIAAGGTLFFAFPLLYASSFSGFYLPLMLVLWLIVLRALGIEFRHQSHHPLWKTFWDGVFSVGSILLTIFFGAALGNVVRGVPLRADGYFFSPFWTTFTVVPESGILDWFTVTMGVVSLFTLTIHGANFLALKTEGALQQRARSVARMTWWGLLVSSLASAVSISFIRPELWNNYRTHVWGYLFLVASILGLVGMYIFSRRKEDLKAFLSSAAFIAGMLACTAFGLYPVVLPASTDPAYSLTVQRTITHDYGLSVGTVWWSVSLVMAVGYFLYLFRSLRGKTRLPHEGEGY